MIYLEIRNDGTGTSGTGNYDTRLILPGLGEVKARVKRFDRKRGWAALVREAVDTLEARIPGGGAMD